MGGEAQELREHVYSAASAAAAGSGG